MSDKVNEPTEFIAFPKMARLSRECIVTEKLDGTNAQILITEDGQFMTGSCNRWITPEQDNYGFSRWANANKDELMKLGPGRHFGEWWGQGIQRGYGLKEKRFSLFNVTQWENDRPACCDVVPVIHRCLFEDLNCNELIGHLMANGSFASPGFMNPEGIVVYHVASGVCFKKTAENDSIPKSLVTK